MTSKLCLISALLLALCGAASAQSRCELTVEPPAKLVVKREGPAQQKLQLRLPEGCHTNSNKPNEDYLIPLRITWAAGAVEAVNTAFPKPAEENYSFSDKPVSVYSGQFDVTTTFKRSAAAAPGPAVLTGKLRYQACNEKMCFPPKTVEIKLPLLLQ